MRQKPDRPGKNGKSTHTADLENRNKTEHEIYTQIKKPTKLGTMWTLPKTGLNSDVPDHAIPDSSKTPPQCPYSNPASLPPGGESEYPVFG